MDNTLDNTSNIMFDIEKIKFSAVQGIVFSPLVEVVPEIFGKFFCREALNESNARGIYIVIGTYITNITSFSACISRLCVNHLSLFLCDAVSGTT